MWRGAFSHLATTHTSTIMCYLQWAIYVAQFSIDGTHISKVLQWLDAKTVKWCKGPTPEHSNSVIPPCGHVSFHCMNGYWTLMGVRTMAFLAAWCSSARALDAKPVLDRLFFNISDFKDPLILPCIFLDCYKSSTGIKQNEMQVVY